MDSEGIRVIFDKRGVEVINAGLIERLMTPCPPSANKIVMGRIGRGTETINVGLITLLMSGGIKASL